ncbi:Heat shock protein 15 [Mannheimia haemolytica]|uniref:Heat shock protein 15 n=1 Tax=Mannheimia haemolytica TaxID=75985 RepID=A0A378MZC8_MANHA|nr:Heat shock protein 15 [Mannheimia haemolytica]
MKNKHEKEQNDAEVRLDKWLWAARFYKTRSIAKAMIEGGKVHYNGQRAKVSKAVEIGAIIKLRQGNEEKEVEVLALSDQRRGLRKPNCSTVKPKKALNTVRQWHLPAKRMLFQCHTLIAVQTKKNGGI